MAACRSKSCAHTPRFLCDALQDERDPSATKFYEQAAAAAASLGVCMDIFAACPHSLDLQQLAPVATNSGGSIYLYPVLEDAAMPQVTL